MSDKAIIKMLLTALAKSALMRETICTAPVALPCAAKRVSQLRRLHAGSTVALLTIGWGGSLLVGRCDLDSSGAAINKKLTRPWDLFNTGVTAEADVSQGAIAMIAAVLVYFIVQVPCMLPLLQAHPVGLCMPFHAVCGCHVWIVCCMATAGNRGCSS